jgi:hypothetical protein
MDIIFQGWSMWSTMSSKDLKTRFDNQFAVNDFVRARATPSTRLRANRDEAIAQCRRQSRQDDG